MPSRKQCADLIKAQFPKFKKTTIDAILDEMDNIRSQIFSENENLAGPEFRDKVMKYLDERRYQQAAARREAAENLLKRQKLMDFTMQEQFKNDPVEAIKAKLGGTARYAESGKLSVDATRNGKLNHYLGLLWNGLERASDGVDEIAKKGLLDRDTAQALWALDRSEDISKLDPKAVETAKVYKGVNDAVLNDKQQAGSAVKRLTGYITKQTHDSTKIMAAGFDQWFHKTIGKLDIDRTFGFGASEDKIRQAMEGVFNDIVSGKYDLPARTGVSDEFLTVNGRSANLSAKTSQSRSLHFKDGHAWFDYNQEFGSKNLLESIISSINQSSRQVALMYHLGTNPEGAYQAWKRRIRSEYKDNPEVLQKLKENESTLDAWFKTAQGFDSAPGTSLAARTGQNARGLMSLSRLGGAFFSSWGDLPVSISTLRAANGKNLFENVGALVSEYASSFFSKAERQKWAARLGTYLDDTQGHVFAKIGAETAGPGMMSKAQRLFSKVTFMTNHVESARLAMAKQLSLELADHAGTAFTSLPDRFVANLERYGIDAETWNHLSRAVENFEDGSRGVTPEAIDALPDDAFRDGGDRARFEAITKLLTYLNDQANMASTTPGLRQRATLLRGTEDEGLGVPLRLISQFKTVPLMAIDNFKQILLANPDTMPRNLREAILDGKGDINGMVQFMVMSWVVGYAAMTAKDIALGKTPRDPKDPKTAMEAFVKGGAAGIYGDFLFGEFNRSRTAADSILGPVLGQGATLLDLWSKARSGDKIAGEATRLLMSNVPFQNVFYTKAALDYLIMNRIQERLSPGYTRRLESRTRQNPGLLSRHQDYLFLRPTGVNR